MADYHLERLDEENAKRWEEFNAASPEGSLFHSLKWKRMAELVSGTPREYFLLFKNETVVGLFPFVEHAVHGFRGFVPASDPLSLPAILKDASDPFALRHAIEELKGMGRDRKKISFICPAILHNETFDTITTYPLFPYADDGDMVLDLSKSTPETIWNAFSSRSGQRKLIRRFEENGFEITEVRSEDDLRLFYQYYEENMKYIGGDLPPFSYFTALRETMPDEIRITLLSKGSLVAGGTFDILDRPRRKVHGVYLSLNKKLPNKYSPSYYLYWKGVNWAWENDFEKFSFGMEYSRDLNEENPRYRIKRDFGAQFEPVFSRIIPLTKIFSLGVRSKKYWDGWQSIRSWDQGVS
jgi:hypothetical protein